MPNNCDSPCGHTHILHITYLGIIPVGGISDGGILHGGNPSGRFPNGGKHIIKCNKVFISVLFVSMFCLPCNVRPAGLPR